MVMVSEVMRRASWTDRPVSVSSLFEPGGSAQELGSPNPQAEIMSNASYVMLGYDGYARTCHYRPLTLKISFCTRSVATELPAQSSVAIHS